jgi:3-methylcrotonyl-CoA carboxylase alpha subunit
VAGLPHVIRSVLIANRGEIAVRIIRACRELAISPIAVYSDADRDSRHVRLADHALWIGPSESVRSYLDRDRLVAAALEAGADAVHPGYGFLAEDAAFARLVRGAGLLFIGPSPECIERMGSKREAKAIALAVGVPIVPGYSEADQSIERLATEAERIGFPVLIKANGGGGGRGMRVVLHPRELEPKVAESRREALAYFDDDTLLLERLVEPARHIEVQVAGDRHGGLIHLFERDCSIQRRHQKVIEEAPAANLPAAVRARLHADALRVARAVGYDSVGTVEFLVDAASGEHWFLEMNTRLQVEHPVTESVTGVDLVALQLKLARGERLGISQGDVTVTGVAVEARVCAEDPALGYRPALGSIGLYRECKGEGVRVDSGVEEGSVVTPFYDSLLAKVVASGSDRATARRRLARALDGWTSPGVATNARWLAEVVRHDRFEAEPLTTRYLELASLVEWRPAPVDSADIATLTAILAASSETPDAGPWGALGSWRLGGRSQTSVPLDLELSGGSRWPVTIGGSGGRYSIRAGGLVHRVSIERPAAGEAAVAIDDRRALVPAVVRDGTLWAHVGSGDFVARLVARCEPEPPGGSDHLASDADIVAPLPGVVASVGAAVGQTLARGQVAVVIEAMKLVHSLKANRAATVRAVHCGAGMTVSGGQLLMELDPTTEETT